MADFYSFFGIKDKGNRFTMRLNNPLGFDVAPAIVKLSELFAVHGVCPASNDVTWEIWKSGKTLYQWWNVTPNKLGLIRSDRPTLTLSGVDYASVPIYLLSLDDYTNIYGSRDQVSVSWKNLANDSIYENTYVSDFVPLSVGDLDIPNMTGIFYNMHSTWYNWDTIRPWIEDGNIFVDTGPYHLINKPFSVVGIISYIGDYVECVLNETEVSPLFGETGPSTAPASDVIRIYNENFPVGWTARTIVEINIGGTAYHQVIEGVHNASGGRYIALGGKITSSVIPTRLPEWWYPILAIQYPMMKYAGVAAYFTE